MNQRLKTYFAYTIKLAVIVGMFALFSKEDLEDIKNFFRKEQPCPGLVGSRRKKWKSLEEIKELFEKKGLSYTDCMIFDEECKFLSNVDRNFITFDGPIKRADPARAQYFRDCIESLYYAPLYVKWVNDDIGYGVYAAEKINKGDYIIEYTGMIKKSLEETSHAWQYPCNAGGFGPEKMVFAIDASMVGNIARFVNDPINDDLVNVGLGMVYQDNYFHVIYIAYKDIEKNQQLFVSYGKEYWKNRPYGKKIESNY